MASEDFVRRHGLEHKAVEIIAQEMVTDMSSTFEENSCIKMVRLRTTARVNTHSNTGCIQSNHRSYCT